MAKIGIKTLFNIIQSYIIGLNSRSVDYVQGAQLDANQTVPLTNYAPLALSPLNDIRSNTYLYQPIFLTNSNKHIEFVEGVQFIKIDGALVLNVQSFEGSTNLFYRVMRNTSTGAVQAALFRQLINGTSISYDITIPISANGIVSNNDYYTIEIETSQAVAENKISVRTAYFTITTSTRPRHNAYTDKVLWD